MIELSPELPSASCDWVLRDPWGAARDASRVVAAVEGRLVAARASGVVAFASEAGSPLGVVAARESPWDAEGLGGPVTTVDLLALTTPALPRALAVVERLADVVDQFSRDRGALLDWLRVDERDDHTLRVLLQRGFEVRGALVSLVAPTDRLAAPDAGEGGPTVRPASAADLPWLARLAADAFTQSRFRDPQGPAGWHAQVYARWVASRLSQRGDDLQVLVAELDGAPAGFVIWKVHTTPAVTGRIGQVDLVAVDPRARRRGVGRALFDEARRRSGPLGWMAADVYAANPAGRALHERYGLAVGASARYLHRWRRPVAT
jgi:ribosomal protein S18 acetylase RimI-like enzyme